MTTDILEVRSEVRPWKEGESRGFYISAPKEFVGKKVELRMLVEVKPFSTGGYVTVPQAKDLEGQKVILRLIEEPEEAAEPVVDIRGKGAKKK